MSNNQSHRAFALSSAEMAQPWRLQRNAKPQPTQASRVRKLGPPAPSNTQSDIGNG